MRFFRPDETTRLWDPCPFATETGFHTLICVATYWDREHFFADDIFVNENNCILIEISLKCVPRDSIIHMPALVRIIVWHRQATSHYLKQRWPSLLTHICVTRPQRFLQCCGRCWIKFYPRPNGSVVVYSACIIQAKDDNPHSTVSVVTQIYSLNAFHNFIDTFNMLKYKTKSWWRHQMETFSALLAICAGNSPVPGEFPAQRPVTQSFDVFFHLRLNKRLSKQS